MIMMFSLNDLLLLSFVMLPPFGLIPIVLFHNYFSPRGEQHKQCILAYKSEQPTVGCITIFHKCCCYIKYEGIIRNLTQWSPWGYATDMSNTTMQVYGSRIRIYYVLCSETYGTFSCLFWSPAGVPSFVRFIYCKHICPWDTISSAEVIACNLTCHFTYQGASNYWFWNWGSYKTD